MLKRLLPRRDLRDPPPCRPSLRLLALFFVGSVGAQAQDLGLKWQAGDASKMFGGYLPQRLMLSSNKPASVKKLPAQLTAPSYGELKIGPRENPGARAVLLDEPKGAAPRLFLDANGNGDLTDDAAVAWTPRTVPGSGGVPVSMHVGEGTVKIPFASGAVEGRLGFYRINRGAGGKAGSANELYYYRDYLLQGRLMLGGKPYLAALVDEFASGDFRGRDDPQFSGVRLLLDLNGDSRFDVRRESMDVRKPFNVGGTTWELANLTADGKFSFIRSSQSAPVIVVPPNLGRGAKALPFTARTTTGKAVKFPEDYKGKVVLLDFWATWCGPCLMELPNVVQSYAKYHGRGFDILGISLDKAESIPQLAAFTKEKNMPWPQICDGKMWQTDLAVRYGVEGIPFMLLVDGDTGEILASTMEVRGENLGPAIEAGLARKKRASR